MSLDEHDLRVAADALRAAEDDAAPIPPLTESHAGMDVQAAYAVQRLNATRRVEEGDGVVGRKVGLTSRAMQEMLGVDEPDFGVLHASMLVDSGEEIALSGLVAPRIEAEIAFVLERDLEGPTSTVGARRAIGAAVASLEVIDSRIEDWRIALPDTVADNASSARVVLGSVLVDPDALDLRLAGVLVTVNGREVGSGIGAAALGDPVRCVAWLANTLARFGESLRAGDVVLPGALHRAVAVEAGDAVLAEFAGLGSVAARFS